MKKCSPRGSSKDFQLNLIYFMQNNKQTICFSTLIDKVFAEK